MPKRHKLSKSSLHWFIKSRPYVLVPEIRRRFEIDSLDESFPIESPGGRAFIALPERAAKLLEDLVKEHRIGVELAPDLGARMVVGVFAFDILRQPVGQVQMRPSSPIEVAAPDHDEADDDEEEDARAADPAAGERPGDGSPPPVATAPSAPLEPAERGRRARAPDRGRTFRGPGSPPGVPSDGPPRRFDRGERRRGPGGPPSPGAREARRDSPPRPGRVDRPPRSDGGRPRPSPPPTG